MFYCTPLGPVCLELDGCQMCDFKEVNSFNALWNSTGFEAALNDAAKECVYFLQLLVPG